MEVKTNLHVGLAIDDFGQFAQDVWDGTVEFVQNTGEALTPVGQSIWDTVTNPKFWTWPF